MHFFIMPLSFGDNFGGIFQFYQTYYKIYVLNAFNKYACTIGGTRGLNGKFNV